MNNAHPKEVFSLSEEPFFLFAINAIDSEYMITLITQIFEEFIRSNRYRDNRDNRQVSTSLYRIPEVSLLDVFRNLL